jgi:hypothetical protein
VGNAWSRHQFFSEGKYAKRNKKKKSETRQQMKIDSKRKNFVMERVEKIIE